MSSKNVFIYCDLNKLASLEYYPLKNSVVIQKIEKNYGSIKDGMRVWLYSDTFKESKFDPTLYPGIIRKVIRDGEYRIFVNENDMEYLSESERFKDYTIEDIIGTKSLNLMKKKHPEWF